ncbi:methyl-accepting chemotaxis protein [Paenibacillus sp. Z6-24]
MTVRAKLLSGFAGMMILILILGVLISARLNSIGDNANDIRGNSIPSLVSLYRINDKVTDVENLVLRSIIEQDDTAMQQINSEISSTSVDIAKNMQLYETYLSDEEEIQLYNSFKESWTSYTAIIQQVLEASDVNNDTLAMNIQFNATPMLTSMNEGLSKLVDHNVNDVTRSADGQLSEFYLARWITWAAVVAAILIGSVLALVISRMIVRPLHRMLEQVNYIASGDLTRTAELPVEVKDELGDLAKGLQQMGNSLNTVIAEVNETSQRLNDSAEELTAIAEENASTSAHTTESLVSMADRSADQTSQSEQGALLVQSISANIQEIDNRIEQVSQSAQTAADHSVNGTGIVTEAAGQMEAAQSRMNEMNGVVNELRSRSQEIGSIVGIITGIAGQTNLLALNAAIEAARAGEHGKGFAVVAAEVQKLAEQSSSSAGQIVSMIDSIQQDTDRLHQAMDMAAEQILSGTESMKTTGDLFEDIKQSVNEVAAQSREAAQLSGSMNQSAEAMEQSITGIVGSIEHSSDEIRKISAASEQQSASMLELSSSAAALSEMAEEMNRIVDRFKL